jgi:hypothetical protein
MSTNIVTATTFETIRPCEMEQAAGVPRPKLGFQFWSSTFVGSFLLMLGVWVLFGAQSVGPMASDFSGMVAVSIWMCVPAFVYFAWQGYRSTREPAKKRR